MVNLQLGVRIVPETGLVQHACYGCGEHGGDCTGNHRFESELCEITLSIWGIPRSLLIGSQWGKVRETAGAYVAIATLRPLTSDFAKMPAGLSNKLINDRLETK